MGRKWQIKGNEKCADILTEFFVNCEKYGADPFSPLWYFAPSEGGSEDCSFHLRDNSRYAGSELGRLGNWTHYDGNFTRKLRGAIALPGEEILDTSKREKIISSAGKRVFNFLKELDSKRIVLPYYPGLASVPQQLYERAELIRNSGNSFLEISYILQRGDLKEAFTPLQVCPELERSLNVSIPFEFSPSENLRYTGRLTHRQESLWLNHIGITLKQVGLINSHAFDISFPYKTIIVGEPEKEEFEKGTYLEEVHLKGILIKRFGGDLVVSAHPGMGWGVDYLPGDSGEGLQKLEDVALWINSNVISRTPSQFEKIFT
ncbi:MAG: hypothetical protein ABIH72_05740 [archaeon]